MYQDVRDFFYKWQIWLITTGEILKGNVQLHIKSDKSFEIFQKDYVQLASMITTKEIKYLFIMVDDFSKYGWARWIVDKTSQTTIKALKNWLVTHNKPDIIQSDNGKEFTSREFR